MECRINRQHGVTLGKHKPIPLRVFGTARAQKFPLKHGDDVGNRQGRSNVTNIGPFRLFKDDAPDAL
jgi:hypothetical protein